MSPDQIFGITNPLAAVGWLLLAVAPNREWVTRKVTGVLIPSIFAVAYIAIVVTTFAGAEGSFATLSGVRTLFSNDWLLLAGWLHYLAFDLLIGTWEARDAMARGISRWLLVPCLFLTFMFGPTGWLLYMITRSRYAPTRVAAGA